MGREREIAALQDALGRAADGSGGVAFLVGEPGVGKSRLAQVAVGGAVDRGLRVLHGRAVPSPTPVAYRPLAEALCGAVRGGVVADDAAELMPFRSILGWLVPEWRDDDARVDDSVMALAEGVLRFLRVVADRRGSLVVLEDAHWADPETLRIIEYLADNLASERVLCLVTVRDEGRSPGLQLARTLHARRVSQLLELSRLSSEEVAVMVASCLDADSLPDDVLDLAAHADGVPFLVEELLAAAITSGALFREGTSWMSSGVETIVPLTFSDSVRQRLASLGEPAGSLLRAAAVLGRRFDWSLLSAITGVSETHTVAGLRVATEAQILSVDTAGGTFAFRHALSRDAVLAELLPPERTALSRRALEAVEAAHPDLENGWCEVGADLAEAAGHRSRAGALLLEAGRRSSERGALASAEAALDRARGLVSADEPAMLDVDELLCRVLSLAGKRERALQIGKELLVRLGEDASAAQRRAGVLVTLARAALAATQWDEAEDLLERARAESTSGDDERLAAQVNAVRAQAAVMGDPERGATLAQTAVEAAERLFLPEVACEALEVLGRSERPRDLEAAEAVFARALALAETHGLTVWRARALHELGTIDMLHGRSVSRLEKARELAVAQGALATAAVVDVQIAAGVVLRDDPAPAVAAARRSVEVARTYGLEQTLAAAVALEAYVHARSGDRQALQRCVREARALAPGVPDIEVKTASASAILALREEDRAAAHSHLHSAIVQASSGPGGDYSATPGAGLLALLNQVDAAAGEPAADRLAERSVHFVARGLFYYARAVAAGRAGDRGVAAALVADGDRTLGDHNWLRQLGRRLLAEAALADGWGQPLPWLREALSFFEHRGEERIASACRSLLRRAGVAVPRQRREDDDDLPAPLRAAGVTSRELEVLRLLAEGLPNRDIAARLYLSPRTVERHIANIAVKVDVAGRSQLVAFAARVLGDIPADGPDR